MEKDELKGEIENLMNQYSNEEIDGETYFNDMMDLTTSYQEEHEDDE